MLIEKLGMPIPEGFPLVMSGAGLCKTFDHSRISEYAWCTDATVIGSITPEQRDGNTGRSTECFVSNDFSINAIGMTNPGADAQVSPGYGHIIASIAGFSVDDYVLLTEKLANYGAGLEYNLGCPNAGHGIMSFDPGGIEELLTRCLPLLPSRQIRGIKLSPYSDPGLLNEIASTIAPFAVDYIATCNTFPNGLGYIGTKPMLSTDQLGNFGGIGGRALKPISLGQAAQFRMKLPDEIDVIRVGGVENHWDLKASMDVGCVGVQLVTAIVTHGSQLPNELRHRYVAEFT